MMDEMANHATRVRRYMDKLGVEKVEDFIDACLSLENLIDFHVAVHRSAARTRSAPRTRRERNERVQGFKTEREYMREFINPPAFLRGAAEEARRGGGAPEAVPRAAGARRAAVPARARAARALGARRALHHPRRGLLLRAAGPDQDHERGLGHATGTPRS